MPIYEYKCSVCGQHFEQLVLSRDEEVHCTKCGAKEVERKMSGFSTGGGGLGEILSRPSSSCGGGGGFS